MTARKNYIISDLHFDHDRIIQYCNRSFPTTEEMNRVLLENWLTTVQEEDRVFFVGDLTWGKQSKGTKYWYDQLNGDILFIKGNHDTCREISHTTAYVHVEQGTPFYLVHDPTHRPKKWNGWMIHGHVHNNDMENYPFINGETKTINASAELLNYTPVSIDDILALDLPTIKRMETYGGPIKRF